MLSEWNSSGSAFGRGATGDCRGRDGWCPAQGGAISHRLSPCSSLETLTIA